MTAPTERPALPPTVDERAEWRKDAETMEFDWHDRVLRLLDAQEDAERLRCDPDCSHCREEREAAERERDHARKACDIHARNADNLRVRLNAALDEAAERARTPATAAPNVAEAWDAWAEGDHAEVGAFLDRDVAAEPSVDAASVKQLADEYCDALIAYRRLTSLPVPPDEENDPLGAAVERVGVAAEALYAAIDKLCVHCDGCRCTEPLAAEHREARNEVRVLRDAIDRQAARARAATGYPLLDSYPAIARQLAAACTPAAHHDGEEDALAAEVDMVQERGDDVANLPRSTPPLSGARCARCCEHVSRCTCDSSGATCPRKPPAVALGAGQAPRFPATVPLPKPPPFRTPAESLTRLREYGNDVSSVDLWALDASQVVETIDALRAEVAALRADRDACGVTVARLENEMGARKREIGNYILDARLCV